MTTQEKINRLEALDALEIKLKAKRDFEGLISIHDEAMELGGAIGDHIDRLPQKAYCLARLGKKEKALEVLKEYSSYSLIFGEEEIKSVVNLILLFVITQGPQTVSMQKNTINAWLQDTHANMVMQIIFDYEDFVGNVALFDYQRLNKRQTEFPQELLECTFFSMQRERDDKIYYNRETNDIQSHGSGYFTSLLPSKEHERTILTNRMLSQQPKDAVIDGIHFLVPRLDLTVFLDTFLAQTRSYPSMELLIDRYKELVMEQYEDYVDSIDDLVFTQPLDKMFYDLIHAWASENNISPKNAEAIIMKVITNIAREFLIEVNN
jgi:hypothetical protein